MNTVYMYNLQSNKRNQEYIVNENYSNGYNTDGLAVTTLRLTSSRQFVFFLLEIMADFDWVYTTPQIY